MRNAWVDIRQRMYNIVRDDDENTLISNVFDITIISFIIISVLQVFVDTFDMPAWYYPISRTVEIVSTTVFTIEYIVRVITSPLMYTDIKPSSAFVKYVFSPMAIIDLLAILPFYIPFLIPVDLRVLRSLRIIRLFRIFKINRYVDALSSIGKVLKNKAGQLISSLFVVSLLMVISSVIMYNIESAAQPDAFSNALDALWWSVATFTTVGYGDIYPVTVAGKILSSITAVLGIGLVAVPTGIISAGFTESISHENEKENEESNFCPYCGKELK